jgi:hypothetical protein
MEWVFQYLSDAMTSLAVVAVVCAAIALAALVMLASSLLRKGSSGKD